ncbi:hypothetical protein [Myroides marinus]|uniref:hypothetical protein n=1 Tax=Myroides marinus TaxID=703342 RepID=UPI002574B211|nr:hypothetical protein [Myroides marinus]MDM1346636.1 hypothetical protein [Myroides marinus]
MWVNWAALETIPVMKYITLINPLVYINEALRFILNSGGDTMPIVYSILGIVVFTIVMGYYGMKRFIKMANR